MALSLAAPMVVGFSAPIMRSQPVKMFEEGDIGVLPPLGVYDPLGLIEKRDMRRFEIMEIKHGRAAMLGFLHVIHIESGVRFPGYLSGSAELKFTDVPSGLFASLEAVPTLGWLQILAVGLACETGYAGRDFSVVRQEGDKEVRAPAAGARTTSRCLDCKVTHCRLLTASVFVRVRACGSRATSVARAGCATRTRRSRPTSSTSSARTAAPP